ncbi:DUF2061 domain-containing protein [Candidatus Woesearchaeota archaeon]|nr:DUF2061 domain-containing protein [Candidatus Woesearchaeota archaeon]
MEEYHIRSILKAVSWRIFATVVTIFIVFIFTGNFIISLGVGFVEVLSKIFFYYVHERIWNKIKWGKIYAEKIQ